MLTAFRYVTGLPLFGNTLTWNAIRGSRETTFRISSWYFAQ